MSGDGCGTAPNLFGQSWSHGDRIQEGLDGDCEVVFTPHFPNPQAIPKDPGRAEIHGILKQLDEVLCSDRAKSHGDFAEQHQSAGVLIAETLGLHEPMPPVEVMLSQICLKLSRIKHGESAHIDHYLDIAGYAILIAAMLKVERRYD